MPTTVTRRAGSVEASDSRAPSAGAIAGDDLAGRGGGAAGAQHVRGERRAAPAVGDGFALPEARRHRHVADRGLHTGDGRQPGGQRGVDAGALA